jgi:hypothetical protein
MCVVKECRQPEPAVSRGPGADHSGRSSVQREVTIEAWRALAQRLGVEEAVLRAVADVESAGSGFLPAPSELPKVLFEGHVFSRLTQGRFDASHPGLSYPKWDKSKYAGSLTGEWKRLDAACALERTSALQAASWGAFQIMGFNYGLCGFADVEAFVAAQKAGALDQAESFAQFIARDLYLVPLKSRDWKAFAAAYNGPSFAKNQYDQKLEAAYDREVAAAQIPTPVTVAGPGIPAGAAAGAAALPMPGAAARAGRAARAARQLHATNRRGAAAARRDAGAVLAPGRRDFAGASTRRRRGTSASRSAASSRRSVNADPIDLRDWVYHPNIAIAPPAELIPAPLRPVGNQRHTNACTGFALATVIEYLLQRGKRPVDAISGYMLYSMARRYDEWAQNDGADDGSSLRGALKGWSRHGASLARLWHTLAMPPVPAHPADDWWQDGVTRPLGAYYRLTPNALSDIHTALVEAGAVYASAQTHSGWDELMNATAAPPPTDPTQLPIIPHRQALSSGGHSFAIVGYTADGFIVQNSWGPKWGRGGFGVLAYGDWVARAMDCWVMQLGVVTKEHLEVAAAEHSTLRVDMAGRVQMSNDNHLATHEISAFVVDMEHNGHLSPRGLFRTTPGDLEALLDVHATTACKRWGIGPRQTLDVAMYAHGGLGDEEAAAASAKEWIPLLYQNRILPVFLMWETNCLDTLVSLIDDSIPRDKAPAGAPAWDAFKTQFSDWQNQRIEGIARVRGSTLWKQVKGNAENLSSAPQSGIIQLFERFKAWARKKASPSVRLHLIGHSSGTIVLTWLGGRALRAGFDVGSINLLAPAVRVDLFGEQLGDAIARKKVPTLLAHLTDAAERDDPTCAPYGHSLLYLVSRAYEDHTDTPILGLERFLIPAVVTEPWGAQLTRLASPGGALRPGARIATATTHGSLDDDPAVQDAVVQHIKGTKIPYVVVR